MEIPLQNRLKKRAHAQVALLQDEVADLVYSIFPKIAFHGGTCIWRCYGGNRFSEDLDFYLPRKDFSAEKLRESLASRALSLDKLKMTESLLFSKISSNEAQVRLEINFSAAKKPVVRTYEKADGSRMDVLALSAEELMLEKIAAYQNRRLIRDIYDIYYLSGIAKEDRRVTDEMHTLLQNPPKPLDEKNLRAIVYTGAVPSFAQMLEVLRGRFA